MANKRMFSLDVVNTDLFLDMPASTQNLYFHLGMRADDDGFVASPKQIVKLINCTSDDMRILVSKGYVIPFETGVIVICHWKQNNYIRSDRYHQTKYIAEKHQLQESNGVYSLSDSGIPYGNQLVDNRYTQVRVDKSRLDNNSTFPADIFKQSLYKCCLRVHPFGHFTFDTGCDIYRQSRKLFYKQSH